MTKSLTLFTFLFPNFNLGSSEITHVFSNSLFLLTVFFESFDDSHQIDSVYLDFRKAFDKVPHAETTF